MAEGFGKSTIGGKLTRQIKAKDAQANTVLCKTLAAWMNANLAKRGLAVPADGDLERLLAALADGLLLLQLLHTLTGHAPPRGPHSPASSRLHRLDNCSLALEMARPYTAVEIAPADLVDAQPKPVLALLWRLVLCFQVHERPEAAAPTTNSAADVSPATTTVTTAAFPAVSNATVAISVTSGNAAVPAPTPISAVERQRAAAAKLLAWLGKMLGPNLAPADLTEAFHDGYLLLALVRAYDVRLVDLSSVSRGDSAAATNVPRALELAERELGVPRLLDAADFLNPDPHLRPTEQCMIAYLSEFPRVFAAKASEERGVTAKPHDNYGLLLDTPVATTVSASSPSAPSLIAANPVLGGDAHVADTPNREPPEGLGFTQLHSVIQEDPARVERLLAAREQRLAHVLKQSAELGLKPLSPAGSRLWEPGRVSPRADGGPPSPRPEAAEPPRSPRGLLALPTTAGVAGSGSTRSTPTPLTAPTPLPVSGGSLRHPIGLRPPSSPRLSTEHTAASISTVGPIPVSTVPAASQRPTSPDSMQRLAELEAQAEAATRRATLHEAHSAALRSTLDQIRRENEVLRRELRTIAAQCIGRLQVRVVAARHILPTNFFTRDADPYVLLKVDKQSARTKTMKHTLHPTWNAEFSFYVKGPLTRLEVTLMDWERFHDDTSVASTSISIAAELEPGLQNDQWWTLQPVQYSRGGVAGPPAVGRSSSREVQFQLLDKEREKDRLLPSSASLLHHNPSPAQLRRTPDPMLHLLLTFTPAVPVASAP